MRLFPLIISTGQTERPISSGNTWKITSYSGAVYLQLHWQNHIFHRQLLLLVVSLFWSDGQDKRLSVWGGMDKMSKVPPCLWSADVSWLTRRGLCWQCLQSASVLAEWRSSDFFFFTEKQTQLFKYSIFYAFSSLLPTAPVCSLFVAGEAGLVTALMAAAQAAGKNTDI